MEPEMKKLYKTWDGMRGRCYRPNEPKYKNYGGRGITICEEWSGKTGFANFVTWSYANGFEMGLTIDRIDVNGNYEPLNCRWITNQEQQNNKTNNHYITYNGETKSMTVWARLLGIKTKKAEKLVYKKKLETIEEWLEYLEKQKRGEIRGHKSHIYYYNDMTMEEISEKYNIKLITLYARRKKNPDITFEELVKPTNEIKSKASNYRKKI